MNTDRIIRQSAEFGALEALASAYKALTYTPVVDDDYPEVRHRYERCLQTFLSACRANGRTAP